jgi:hypothetical protein
VCVCVFVFQLKWLTSSVGPTRICCCRPDLCVSFITKCPAVRPFRKIALPAEQSWVDCWRVMAAWLLRIATVQVHREVDILLLI